MRSVIDELGLHLGNGGSGEFAEADCELAFPSVKRLKINAIVPSSEALTVTVLL